MSSAAREKGHAYERWVCKWLIGFGFDAVTSRSESKRMDDKGVDIIDDSPYYIQCKAVERLQPGYHEILKGMPTEKIPVIFHKRNNKGTVVAMKLEDFEKIMKCDVDQQKTN